MSADMPNCGLSSRKKYSRIVDDDIGIRSLRSTIRCPPSTHYHLLVDHFMLNVLLTFLQLESANGDRVALRGPWTVI